MVSQQVLYSITGNKHLQEANVDQISTIVKEYPYFSPAQFLLALKQKHDKSYNYQYQLQKASLYFSNQIWLNYLVNEKEVPAPDLNFGDAEPAHNFNEPIVQESIFPTSIFGTQEHYSTFDNGNNDASTSPSAALHNPENNFDIPTLQAHDFDGVPEPAITENTDTKNHSLFASHIEIPTLETVKQLLDAKTPEGYKLSKPEETNESLFSFPDILKEPIATVVEPTSISKIPSFLFKRQDDEPSPAFLDTEKDENHNLQPEGHSNDYPTSDSSLIYFSKPSNYLTHEELIVEEPISDFLKVESDPHNNIDEENKPIQTIQESISSNTIPSYSFKGFADDAPSYGINFRDTVSISEAYSDENIEEDEVEVKHQDDSLINISKVISNQVVDYNKPIEENAKLDFENEKHNHTVDYFASLGIKIDLTKQPQDKLTMQLRRFTDWLKQMKNTDPNPRDLGTDPELEKAIQNIAKTSIEAREIVTETMADVFIKQGKVSKAIQLYIKLSFLDPSKSTYFANKIQQLKGI